MATTGGYAPEVLRAPGYVEAITRPLQLGDIIPMFPTSQAAYKYMEETTRIHAAAFAAEGTAFAESTFVFTERSSPVQKITDSVPVTDEQLEDVGMIESYLDSRLNYGIKQKFDATCLVGDGTGANLRGLKNVVGIQTQVRGALQVADAIYLAMTKVRLVGRSTPSHTVMHYNDWQNLRLMRDVNGQYILGNPTDAITPRLWGLPVIEQDADAAGTAYVGAFDPSTVAAYEKKGVDIQMGYVNNQFMQGQRTVRGDMRMALVFRRPVAFCSVTGL
jgi:HK97 family phage major capsid protein